MARAPQVRRLNRGVTRSDNRRTSASAAGYGNKWSTITAPGVRERDEWMCQECVRVGGVAMAIEEMANRPQNKNGGTREPIVDHIVPAHAIAESRFYDMDNLETLCDGHHAEKTQRDLKKYGAAKR